MSETDENRSPYVESPVIMTTVRIVAPFTLTYGLVLTFHGADSPGGGFQGGAVIGATILMIAFAFGIEPTRDWLANRTVVLLSAGGVLVFGAVGLLPMLTGGRFLQHALFETVGIPRKYGLEAMEVGGIAPIVAGIVVGLFFVIAAGVHDVAPNNHDDEWTPLQTFDADTPSEGSDDD